ncbi:hypothetical protein CIB48_g4044 [Xylaria polymorpha]|nr:hypothetical protein CIB48_g4044 [Xylaria polymorpha]
MVHGFDMGYCLTETTNQIMRAVDHVRRTSSALPDVPVIMCTDSYSLYEAITKLGTTAEKRLMIDIMALRESYERKEIHEIRWIHGDGNPADAMTKTSPNKALKRLIDHNELLIRIEGSVERKKAK